MNERLFGSTAAHRHHDRIEHEFTANRWLGRPADYLSGEQIHHNSEVEPTLPGSYVGYVCDPGRIRFGDAEIPLKGVRYQSRSFGRGVLSNPISPYGSDTVDSHEARDTMLATCFPGFSKIEKYPRRSIDPVACDKRCTD